MDSFLSDIVSGVCNCIYFRFYNIEFNLIPGPYLQQPNYPVQHIVTGQHHQIDADFIGNIPVSQVQVALLVGGEYLFATDVIFGAAYSVEFYLPALPPSFWPHLQYNNGVVEGFRLFLFINGTISDNWIQLGIFYPSMFLSFLISYLFYFVLLT